MKVSLLKLAILAVLSPVISLGNSSATPAPFYHDHNRGWHWYELLPLLPEEEKNTKVSKDPIAPSPRSSPPPQTPTELVKAYRQELETRLHRAWVNPTPANIKAYQTLQKDMLDRSKAFSKAWLQTVFANPELDHTLVSPVNQQARHLHLDLEKERTARVIKGLSQTFGLFFFFSGACPYCHQFAPLVKSFAQTHGWEVIAISVDGGAVAGFPHPQADNGLFQTWGIKVLPALYAVNPQTREAIPIAHGLTSLDDMEHRIMTLTGGKP